MDLHACKSEQPHFSVGIFNFMVSNGSDCLFEQKHILPVCLLYSALQPYALCAYVP